MKPENVGVIFPPMKGSWVFKRGEGEKGKKADSFFLVCDGACLIEERKRKNEKNSKMRKKKRQERKEGM